MNLEKYYNHQVEVNDIISGGLLELYVAGATTAEENRQVEVWAEQYPEVREEIESLQEAMESYVLSQAKEPPPGLKEKIFAQINPSQAPTIDIAARQAPVYRMPASYKWAVAATILLLVGSLALNYSFYNKYNTASRELQLAQTELQRQQSVAKTMEDEVGVMKDRNAIPVVMNGTEKSPEAVAKIFWMKNNGDVYVDASNLPQTPSGMQYQLWAIVDGKPMDAGMISTEKGTVHLQKMKSFGKVQAFAVTLETAGGNPTPKGDMIVQAKI